MKKFSLLFFLLISAGVIFPAAAQFHCGPIKLRSDPQGRFFANGEQVGGIIEETTDATHWTIQFSLTPASDGRFYGFRLVSTGKRMFLNVQLLIAGLDTRKFIDTYDCKEVHE